MYDVPIPPVVAAPDIIGLTHPATPHDGVNGRTVVRDVQPVAPVGPIAIHGNGLVLQAGTDDGRDELLRVLAGPLISGTVGGRRGQPVDVVVGRYQMIGRCRARRVRGGRGVGGGLAERGILGP